MTAPDPLDAAIEAALRASSDRDWLDELTSGPERISISMGIDGEIDRAVRTAEPILTAPIKRERDEARADVEDLKRQCTEFATTVTSHRLRVLNQETELADLRARLAEVERERDALARLLEAATSVGETLRARLATAERDALNRAADDMVWEPPYSEATALIHAEWLRERAKAVNGDG